MSRSFDIGFDLDNTIISYDASFHSIGVSEGLIPNTLPPSKSIIRNYLIKEDKHDDFIYLQSLVYGVYIKKANLFDDFLPLFRYLCSKYNVCIISHKTVLPNTGPQVNLHDAATEFLYSASIFNPDFPPSSLFFCTTQDEKISKINSTVTGYYFDDLPKILALLSGPQPVLFDPLHLHNSFKYTRVTSWSSVPRFLDL